MSTARLACGLLAAVAAAAATRRRANHGSTAKARTSHLAIAPSRDELVVDLVGQLWRLPIAGGAAQALTPPAENARNPRYSPDGTRVVYQRFDGGQWDLWLLDLATADQTALTATPYDERHPDFMPDGRSVVFVSEQTGHACLWSLALDSGVQTQLTEEPGEASFPTVSEGGLVAYVLEQSGQSALRVLSSAGVGMAVYTSTYSLSAPSWRPGGDVLLFGERDATGLDRLRMLLLAEPRVLKTLTEGEDLFRARPAWPTPSEFLYTADGQIWRRGIAIPGRRPVHLFAARAVESRTPPTDLLRARCSRPAARARNRRSRTVGRRPANGIHGAWRPMAHRSRQPATAHGRRFRRARPDVRSRRRLRSLRERSHRGSSSSGG